MIRTGQEFVQSLRSGQREVWIEGVRITDVTTHPALAPSVRQLANLYDLQHDAALSPRLTYQSPTSGQPVGLSFIVPKSKDDLVRRREAFCIAAEATLGLMGRTPEFLNTTLAAFAEARDFFAKSDSRFGDNIVRYYEYVRENDLFLTHALITPQNDRSQSSSKQAEEFLHMGVVRETSEGIVIRGARMLATLGPVANEALIYPGGAPLKPGDEKHALAFAIPIDTPGLRQICRLPFAHNGNAFDHPLASNFEESDSLLVFNDVLVPWERVFIYRDIGLSNSLAATNFRNHTAHQTAVRGLAKMQLAIGVAMAVAQAVKSDVHLHVQKMLGDCLTNLELIKGCIVRSEVEAEMLPSGAFSPAFWPLQTVRTLLPYAYPKVIEILQTIGAGGLLMMPSAADFTSPIAADANKYYRGAEVSSVDRTRIYKIAWDLAGEAFGMRSLQYERYYAGDPVRNLANFYLQYDKRDCERLVDRALKLAGDPVVK